MVARRQSRSKKIDNLRWLGFRAVAGALVTGSPQAQLVLTATTTPDTIMRTRGQLIAYIPQTQAPGVGVEIGVGIHIVPEGTGTTILQAPLDDANADWFYYSRFMISYEEAVTDVIDSPMISAYREAIDSKAMRIGRPDTEVQVVFESASVIGGVNTAVIVGGRFLLGT